MRPAIRSELMKLGNSKVASTTMILLVLLVPAMGFGFYWVAVNGGSGPLAGKAAALLSGEGWTGYLGLVGQIAAVAMFVGPGIVVAWMFGREHVERTFPSLFALPVTRSSIAGAKFIVLSVWVGVVAAVLVAITALVALAARLPGPPGIVGPDLTRLFAVAVLAGMLSLTAASLASTGRGYLPAIGGIILVVAAAQVAVLFGTGGWFPFAVPGLLAVAGAEGVPELQPAQVWLVPVLVIAGIWATVRWWRTTEVV